jgi:hypothetical protein
VPAAMVARVVDNLHIETLAKGCSRGSKKNSRLVNCTQYSLFQSHASVSLILYIHLVYLGMIIISIFKRCVTKVTE